LSCISPNYLICISKNYFSCIFSPNGREATGTFITGLPFWVQAQTPTGAVMEQTRPSGVVNVSWVKPPTVVDVTLEPPAEDDVWVMRLLPSAL
jgi:hypothetical protein